MIINVGLAGSDDFVKGIHPKRNDLYGDGVKLPATEDAAGNDTLVGHAGAENNLYGDAGMLDSVNGGDDVLVGGAHGNNKLFGDAYTINQGSGGDDWLKGGINSVNHLVGDAAYLTGTGGNDTILGAFNSVNQIFGDSNYLNDGGVGGNDLLIGGRKSENTIFGDAKSLTLGQGGDDTIWGGDNSANWLYGDGATADGSMFGNDTIIAGNGGVNFMFGDVANPTGESIAGNDRLVSGTGTDHMYGDAMERDIEGYVPGSDLFVFKANSGNDFIYDFQTGHDRIEIDRPDIVTLPLSYQEEQQLITEALDLFSVYEDRVTPLASAAGRALESLGLSGGDEVKKALQTAQDALEPYTRPYQFDDLTITEFEDATYGDSTLVAFDGSNSVTVYGVTGLTESDFMFV